MSKDTIKVRPGISKVCTPDGKHKKKGGLKVWELNYTDSSGRAKRKRVTASGVREAEALLVELRSTQQVTGLSWRSGLDKFIQVKEGENRTPHYLFTARKAVESLLAYLKRDKLIEETSAKDIAGYLNWRGREEKKHRSANFALSVFKSIGATLEEMQLIQGYSYGKVKPLKYKRGKVRPFRPEEITEHLQALPEHGRTVLLFLALTGCRVGAACSLQEDHVYSDYLVLHEKGTAGEGKKLRKVLLSAEIRGTIAAAHAYKELNSIQSSYVFVNSLGNPWNIPSYAKLTRTCWKSAGLVLEDGRPHTRHELRHGLATYLRTQQVDTDCIAKLLGHANSTTTERFYIKTLEEEEATMAREAGKEVVSGFLSGVNVDKLLRA